MKDRVLLRFIADFCRASFQGRRLIAMPQARFRKMGCGAKTNHWPE
jgi:hypothetical protein